MFFYNIKNLKKTNEDFRDFSKSLLARNGFEGGASHISKGGLLDDAAILLWAGISTDSVVFAINKTYETESTIFRLKTEYFVDGNVNFLKKEYLPVDTSSVLKVDEEEIDQLIINANKGNLNKEDDLYKLLVLKSVSSATPRHDLPSYIGKVTLYATDKSNMSFKELYKNVPESFFDFEMEFRKSKEVMDFHLNDALSIEYIENLIPHVVGTTPFNYGGTKGLFNIVNYENLSYLVYQADFEVYSGLEEENDSIYRIHEYQNTNGSRLFYTMICLDDDLDDLKVFLFHKVNEYKRDEKNVIPIHKKLLDKFDKISELHFTNQYFDIHEIIFNCLKERYHQLERKDELKIGQEDIKTIKEDLKMAIDLYNELKSDFGTHLDLVYESSKQRIQNIIKSCKSDFGIPV
ncbi:hypothetical protein [Halobacteriovorax sp. ZH2_bin.1]|uniref:hypothetical protein n=1 Tax=unclassified Halobacteriovorax TaxID=2639665 RepID=UPI003720433E